MCLSFDSIADSLGHISLIAIMLTPAFAPAEYCSPVVSKCPHTSTRCSSEQQPSTGVRMHPIDTNLHAASCQRDNASRHPQKPTMPCLIALSRRAEADDQHAVHNIVTASTPGRKRLQSRHPFSEHPKQLTSDAHRKTNRAWAEETWETRWDTTRCRLRTFIQTPSNKPIGHDLALHSLVRLNRIRTGYGRFNANQA